MNDRTSRRLLIIFALCILLSLGAIAIGFLGIVDLLDSGIVATVRDWIEPIVSIRSDGPGPNADSTFQEGPSAIELEATRLAEIQVSISDVKWPIFLEEDFFVNRIAWPEFDQEDDLAKLTVEIVDGKYRWQAHANDGFVWWSFPSTDNLTDFYAEIEMHQTEGDPYGEMGIVFRLNEDQFYLYEISGEYYSLWRSVPDGWSDLVDWTTSTAIQSGDMNKIAVLALSDQFYLFINGQLVAEITDSHYTTGVVGVAVGIEESGDAGVFEFDNLIIRAPEPILDATETLTN